MAGAGNPEIPGLETFRAGGGCRGEAGGAADRILPCSKECRAHPVCSRTPPAGCRKTAAGRPLHASFPASGRRERQGGGFPRPGNRRRRDRRGAAEGVPPSPRRETKVPAAAPLPRRTRRSGSGCFPAEDGRRPGRVSGEKRGCSALSSAWAVGPGWGGTRIPEKDPQRQEAR